MNQHYFHHNAVLPGQLDAEAKGYSESKTRNPGAASPYTAKDPYSNIPIKPNQMSMENANQLQKHVTASTPAGVISELRKSSPSGHGEERSNRGRELAQNNSLTRVGQDSAGRAANAMMADYRTGGGEYGSSIQKVMPKSRDFNPMGLEDQYSSKPTGGHQNGSYQSLNVENQNTNEVYGTA